ncbi:Thioredoxin-like 1-1 chloroplastic isoform X1 [Quillaja saponaria]|nr:Thioredoxin-like 1-1 chloroplastic isoform X1 [Quillaja saponaria]
MPIEVPYKQRTFLEYRRLRKNWESSEMVEKGHQPNMREVTSAQDVGDSLSNAKFSIFSCTNAMFLMMMMT